MNGINGYQVYQNSYAAQSLYANAYEKAGNAKQDAALQPKDIYEKSDVKGAAGVKETKKETTVLSENAKALLERLKEKYSNMDFTIASYSSTEEAQKYLAGGTKEYSVLIDPQLLEEMAADEETEKKYTELLESATTQLGEIREGLGDDETAVRVGVAFDADGSTHFFAELEKSSERQRERIEKAKEEKAEAKKAEKKKAEKEAAEENSPYAKHKRVRVYADTAEELLEKIKDIDWDTVKTEEKLTKGSIIDLGV